MTSEEASGATGSGYCSTSSKPDPDSPLIPPLYIDEQETWCWIIYNEYHMKQLEQFEARHRLVRIDGFTNPSDPSRFCLGRISNIKRRQRSKEIRNLIHRGIELRITDDNSQVFITNNSDANVYVETRNLVDSVDWSRVVKELSPNDSMVLYDNQEFHKIVKVVDKQLKEAKYLQNDYKILISFAERWDSNVGITSSPSWIEVQIASAFKMITTVQEKECMLKPQVRSRSGGSSPSTSPSRKKFKNEPVYLCDLEPDSRK